MEDKPLILLLIKAELEHVALDYDQKDLILFYLWVTQTNPSCSVPYPGEPALHSREENVGIL